MTNSVVVSLRFEDSLSQIPRSWKTEVHRCNAKGWKFIIHIFNPDSSKKKFCFWIINFCFIHPLGKHFIPPRRKDENCDGLADCQLAVDGLRLVGRRLGDFAVRGDAPPNAEGALEAAAECVHLHAAQHLPGYVGARGRWRSHRAHRQYSYCAVHAGPKGQPSASANHFTGCHSRVVVAVERELDHRGVQRVNSTKFCLTSVSDAILYL